MAASLQLWECSGYIPLELGSTNRMRRVVDRAKSKGGGADCGSTRGEASKPERAAPAAKANHANDATPGKPSLRANRQEFFLPVTGFVWVYPEELKVINHPAFQRLGRINQLGQSYIVFRGATHKRMEHVLGVVHIVQRMIAAVTHNQGKLLTSHGVASEPLSDVESRF